MLFPLLRSLSLLLYLEMYLFTIEVMLINHLESIRGILMANYIQQYVLGTSTSISNDETCLQDFLRILFSLVIHGQ